MKVDEQLKCKDCDWYGSCEYYDRRKETSQICKMFNNTWKFVAELEKIKAEIREWYWQADKQKLSEDPCVVDAMTDLFIRTVDNHISELKGENK